MGCADLQEIATRSKNVAGLEFLEPHEILMTLSPFKEDHLVQIEDLPGPPGWPIIGNLLELNPSQIHLKIEQWSNQYGPIFKFRFGKAVIVAVSDHESISEILRSRPELFQREPTGQLRAKEVGYASGLFNSEGQDWVRQRRMIMAGFTAKHIRSYFPTLLKVTLRLHNRWQQAAKYQTIIDLQQDLTRYTVDVISTLALGIDMNTLQAKGHVIQEHLDRFFPMWYRRIVMTPLPYWRYFKLPKDRAFEASVTAINESIDQFIGEARARIAAQPQLREQPNNLLEAMILAAEEDASQRLSQADVRDNVLTLLLAGEDTTANTLAWMIYLLHSNKSAMQKAREELLRTVGNDVAKFTLEQMQGLHYVEACAFETMRLKPVAPFLLFTPSEDTQIRDVRVPKGTIVWAAFRFDGLQEKHFPHAVDFCPERWLHSEATDKGNVLMPIHSTKRISMPFWGGAAYLPRQIFSAVRD
jgi:cytochrome P450